jgi:hypothetical protein
VPIDFGGGALTESGADTDETEEDAVDYAVESTDDASAATEPPETDEDATDMAVEDPYSAAGDDSMSETAPDEPPSDVVDEMPVGG